MKFLIFALAIALGFLFGVQPTVAQHTSIDKVRVEGGIPSAKTATGPAVNGLALSLTNRQFNMPHGDGYTWMALEMRNEDSHPRWVLGFSKNTDVRVLVTDSEGNPIAPYKYSKYDIDVPYSTNGVPLPPGHSLWIAIPIDAMVPLKRPGTYTVRVTTANAVDTQTNQPIKLVSNPLVIHI